MIPLERIAFLGQGLARPECVVAHRSGLLLVPDWTEPGGVTLIAPDGRTRRLLGRAPGLGVETPLRPNGIALEPGGTVLLAHLGAERGAIHRLHADGRVDLVCDALADGTPLPPANFVARDPLGRIWLTVSTTKVPRAADYRPDAGTGFVAVIADGRARIVADGLGYANECLIAADGRTLWVNETFGRRTTAFDLDLDAATLSRRRTMARFGPGTFPDGLAEAADGALLVTSIVSNRVLRIAPSGAVEILLEDADPDHLAWVEAAFQAGEMGRPHLDQVRSARLRNVSNLAFVDPERGRAALGCLLGDAIALVDLPFAGKAPPHWDADLGPLAAFLQETPPA